jgi:hypothetical protein
LRSWSCPSRSAPFQSVRQAGASRHPLLPGSPTTSLRLQTTAPKQLVPASADSETNEDQPLRDAKTIKSGKKTKAERKAAKEKKKQRRSERGEADGVEV